MERSGTGVVGHGDGEPADLHNNPYYETRLERQTAVFVRRLPVGKITLPDTNELAAFYIAQVPEGDKECTSGHIPNETYDHFLQRVGGNLVNLMTRP